MDFPVALADEGQDFVVESTYPRMRPIGSRDDSGPLVPYDVEACDVLPMPSDSL